MNIQSIKFLSAGVAGATMLVLPFSSGYAQKEQIENPGYEFSAVELTWKNRSPDEWAKRVSEVARSIGVEIKAEYLAEVLAEKNSLGNWQPLREETPDLMFKVMPDYDEIRIVNGDIAESIENLKLSQTDAVRVAANILTSLEKANQLNGLKYDPKIFKVGYHRVSMGATDGTQSEQTIVGYRVTFLAHIDGIPLANAGVRVAVHRSGAISGIRLGGVTTNGKNDKKRPRIVSTEEIRKQFESSIPSSMKPRIAWERIMYVMPEDARKVEIYPTHTISYALVGDSDQGEVISRRKTIGFSLIDSGGEVIDYLKPTKKHESPNVSRDPKQDEDVSRKIHELEEHPH